MFQISAIILSGVLLFYLASFLIGNAVSNKLLIEGPSLLIQRVLIGYSVFILIIKFCLRSDYPYLIGYFPILILLIIGVYKFISEFRWASVRISKLAVNIFASLIFFWVAFYPIIFSDAIFYGNLDPGDLNGFSAGYLSDGGSWSSLLSMRDSIFGSSSWWNLTGQEYSLSDYRASVSYDNFVMLQRWGLPIASSEISKLFQLPIWFGVFTATLSLFMLIPAIVFDFCKENKATTVESWLLSQSVAGVSIVILWYEGLFAHIAAMPVLLFLLFNFLKIFKNGYANFKCLIPSLFIASLLCTWFESVNVVVVVYLATVITLLLFKNSNKDLTKSRMDSLIEALKFGFAIAIFCIIISPHSLIDFFLINLSRIYSGFSPGILGLNWSMLDILLPFPLIRVIDGNLPNINLWIEMGPLGRIIESAIALSLCFIFYKSKYFINLFIFALSILIFSLLKQPYVFWNVVTILQPVIFSFVYLSIDKKILKIRKTFLLFIFSIATVSSIFVLQHDYSIYSRHIYREQFSLIQESSIDSKEIAYITPSLSAGYLRLGWDAPLIWINRIDSWLGLKVKYSNFEKDIEIVAYYNCQSEGKERCAQIKKYGNKSLVENNQFRTGNTVRDFLNKDGSVDKLKLEAEVFKLFGIKYEKLNQSLP